MKEKQEMLDEYLEATRACRHIDEMTRSSLRFFILVTLGIVGAIRYLKGDDVAVLVLSVAGVLVGAMTINTLYRLQQYYLCYIGRVAALDDDLGFSLYSQAGRGLRESKMDVVSISNKTAMQLFVTIPTIWFLYNSAMLGFAQYRGATMLVVLVALLWIDWLFIRILAYYDR